MFYTVAGEVRREQGRIMKRPTLGPLSNSLSLHCKEKKKSSFVQSTMLVTAVNERLIGQSPDTTGDMRICGVDRKTGKRTIN